MTEAVAHAADWTVPQAWADYTPAEHALWDTLFARQSRQAAVRAHPAFLRGLAALGLDQPGVPDFEALSRRLRRLTGWSVVAVPGLVPDAVFFGHLARRTFVAGRFLRAPGEADYLQEPDVFHDIFGHTPLLADPVFADYLQAYGEGGLRAEGLGSLQRLARLYWYSVEFGLIAHEGALKLYGAGIVSSHGESVFALDDPSPHRLGFDLRRVMRTPYRIDDFQQSYFVIDSFADLLDQTLQTDFAPLYRDLAAECDIHPTDLTPGDRIIHRGLQTHA